MQSSSYMLSESIAYKWSEAKGTPRAAHCCHPNTEQHKANDVVAQHSLQNAPSWSQILRDTRSASVLLPDPGTPAMPTSRRPSRGEEVPCSALESCRALPANCSTMSSYHSPSSTT